MSLIRTSLAALLAATCACASYRYLPLAPGAVSSLPPTETPLDYDKSNFLLFHKQLDDSLTEKVFVTSGGTLLAATVWPEGGLLASSDFGASWSSFTSLARDPANEPRVIRELQADPRDPQRLYARAYNGLLASRDGGKSWQLLKPGRRRPVLALSINAEGAVFAAQDDSVYRSDDGGETFLPLPLVLPQGAPNPDNDDSRPDPARVRSVLADPAHPKTVFVSIEPQPFTETFQRRLVGMFEHTTQEGELAHAFFKLPGGQPISKTQFGDPRAGIYVTHDGGHVWEKTGLGVDAWLVAQGGAIYAVPAEPLIRAAGFEQTAPGLASAISAQLHENSFDPEVLRGACRYPGDAAAVASPPPSPIFRSDDEGRTWSRVGEPGLPLLLALRVAIDAQQSGREPWPKRIFKTAMQQELDNHEKQMKTNIGPDQPTDTNGRNRFGLKNRPRASETEVPADMTGPLLSLLEPAGILSFAGPGRPLTGVTKVSDTEIWAYEPTDAYWNQLADAVIRATKRQSELSLGNGNEPPSSGPGFQLLHSTDGGVTWTRAPFSLDRFGILTARGISPYPSSIAATSNEAIVVLAGHDSAGGPWRQLLIVPTPK